jgi:PhnB protein
MTSIMPYLLFDGNCLQAMEFYCTCLDGELKVQKVKDSPAKGVMPEQQQEKVVHARLKGTGFEIAASDWLARNQTPVQGNTVCIFLESTGAEELAVLFEKLSQGAEITDPQKQQFFGSYGALNDRFGVRWMFRAGPPAM